MDQPFDGILETALYAADLDTAEAFYGGVLGLEKVSRQGNRHLFYRCGAGMLLIFNPAETARPVPAGALPVPSHGATGPGHVCFRTRGEQMDRIRAASGGGRALGIGLLLAERGALHLLSRSGRQQPGMRRAQALEPRIGL